MADPLRRVTLSLSKSRRLTIDVPNPSRDDNWALFVGESALWLGDSEGRFLHSIKCRLFHQ